MRADTGPLSRLPVDVTLRAGSGGTALEPHSLGSVSILLQGSPLTLSHLPVKRETCGGSPGGKEGGKSIFKAAVQTKAGDTEDVYRNRETYFRHY